MWRHIEEKLNKSGRKWEPCDGYLSDRYAKLFCKKCGKFIGIHDIVYTDLESVMYCGDCVQEYIKQCPIKLDCGTVISDHGAFVEMEYTNNYYSKMVVDKTCYFNKKGRYIKAKGKRYYI